MREKIAKLFLKAAGFRSAARAGRSFLESYPVREIWMKARHGKEALYPFSGLDEYGKALLGADVFIERQTRFFTLDDIILLPPIFTPLRLRKMTDIQREPLYHDVDMACEIGGFHSRLPLTVASMGSTEVAHRLGPALGKAAAKAGIPMGIGENVSTIWGYEKRNRVNMPSFKERLMAYLLHSEDDMGGAIIQQSVEDAFDEHWNKVYSDPDVTPYMENGKIAFEIKLGQGAKPGLGGETKISREMALRLKDMYYFPEDPERTVRELYERHSAPGTYTPEILRSQLRLLRNNYPKARLWVKCGPFKDLLDVLRIIAEEGADAVLVDGKEGGTGMSPVIALKDLGLPTVACLRQIAEARRLGMACDMVLSGRLYDGGHIVKALCLGSTAVSMGRPFVIAGQEGGARGILNFIEATEVEARMLISALGKYSVRELGTEDAASTDQVLASELGIQYAYA